MANIDRVYHKCLSPSTEDRITARTIYNYVISPFMVHCDKFAPEDKKDPLRGYQKLLFEQGRTHEDVVSGKIQTERYLNFSFHMDTLV